ncbi:RHS repeat-associated core domain-containing protein [Nonomuraea sp. NPDC049480]|uniref:RHS repeat-associated core domain-containing protein n=1 Tax=Nonomuraea sp. NPDC049480 TaxID=3364353 RepID=UPI00378FBF7D
MAGTAAGHPSLIDAAATRAPAAAGTKTKIKPPKGALRPDVFPRVQGTRKAADRRLPSGTARAEALDTSAALEIDDMWPLNGAQVGSTTPTLGAHANGVDGSALHYEFTVCPEPEDGQVVSVDYWCSLSEDNGTIDWPVESGDLPAEVNSWKVPADVLKWGTTYAWKVDVRTESGIFKTSPYRTFVTGARQPAIGAHLASRDENGQEFHALSGNYTTTVVDASVATAGPALSITRSYNSKDARRNGLFGAGWSTRFDMKVEAEPSGSLLVTYPDGQRLRFAPKGDGSFQPPPGTHATLATVSGGGWKLMDKSSTVYHFNAQGRLTRVVDARGRAQELTYGTDGKLAKVTAVGGRSLTFTWNGAHVAGVSTDPVNGTAQTWTYTYNGDTLTQACNPGVAPNCTTYGYTTGSLYRGLVEDDEPVGYWRLGEPATQLAPPPGQEPGYCTIYPDDCEPEPTTEARSLGWGAGPATYRYVTLEQLGVLAGSTDTAAGFTGDSELVLPNMAIARLIDQLSVELWFKTTNSGILAHALGDSGILNGTPLLYVGTDGKLRGQFPIVASNGTKVISPITSPSAVTNGQWHHVVLSGSGSSQKLYLDGVALGTRTGTINRNEVTSTTIGNGFTSDEWPATKPEDPDELFTYWGFMGQIDELALYDRPLTAGEVTEHIQARTAAAPHLLSKITLPSGRIWAQNTYDMAKDGLRNHTDQHGGTWKLGEPTPVDVTIGESTVDVRDPNDNKIITRYDAWRGYRTIARTDQLERKTTYGYDSGGYLSSVEDPNGVITNRSFDKRGNMLATAQCQKPATPDPFFSCFDESLTDPPVSQRWLSYHVNDDNEFDPRNDRVIKVRDGRSTSATDNTYATTFEYNVYGEQTKQTTPATPDFPNGRSASVTYTDGSEPAVGGGTTPGGLVETRTDPKGNNWSYAYTTAGDLAEQTDPEGLVTKLAYDALGRLTSSSKISGAYPDGVTTTFTYDALGRVATATGAGAKNDITDVTHTARTTYGYDPDSNKLSEAVSDLTGGDVERKIIYGYDTFGRLESVTDPEGGVTRQGWNTLGQKVSSTDARGTVMAYAYSKRGELISTTLKGWIESPVNPQPAQDVVLESLSYDPAGRLAARVDAMGRKTSYTYYADDRLSQTIGDDVKLNGSTTPKDVTLEANTYDAAGNLTKQVTGGGKVTTEFVYDGASRLSSKTLAPSGLNRKTSFTYDANDNITKATSTGAGSGTRTETKEYAYNKLNQPTRETIENGDQDLVSTIGYDDRGLVTSITDPRGNASGANAADYTATMRYDPLDRLVETIAPQVQIDKAGTTSQGRPSGKIGYNAVGNKTHQRDAEGRTSTSVFDKAGRLVSASSPEYTPPGGTAVTPTVSHAYDAAGQLIRTTDERGYVTAFDYDQLGRQVRVTDPAPTGQTAGRWVTEYDLAGEKLASVDPTGARTQVTYDDLGRQITATQIERKPANAAYTATMEYDDAGRLVKQTAPGNKVTTFTVNAAGEVTSTTDPLTNKTTMDYDLAGRLVKTTDPNGNATVAEYDLAGRQIAAKDLDASGTGTVLRTFRYGHDPAGNPVSATSPEGHVTKQTFDALNRPTSLIEPVSGSESITTSFGYDATGARTRLTDGRGYATWTSYNSLGLAETVTEPSTAAHPNLADRTWTHVYDAGGNQVATVQPGGVRIDRTFDHLNRLTKETGSGGGAASAERTFGYDLAARPTAAGDLAVDYNDRGLPLKVSRGAAQESAYAYDALGNPTQRIDAAGTAAFIWDNANRLATATDPVTGRTLTYGYDPGSRLKTITATSGQASTQSFDYDAMDRPTGQTLKNGSGTQLAKITYGWDKDDNLTTKTTAGTAGAGTNTYGYDHAGRLTSWTAPGGATTAYEWDAAGNRTKAGNATFTYDERNRLTGGDGTDYTYTPRGTLATSTKAGATTSYTFDAFDRMIADGDSLYAYDALDRVTSRIRGTAHQTFAYAGLGNDLAALRESGGAVQATYARDPGGALLGLKEGTAAAAAALSDLHGDLVATYTTSLQTSTAYDPFGTAIAQTGTKAQLGYQGEYTDPDTGKVNMHARWYQPGTGTFTSRDTATLAPNPSVQANRYAYANSSPLTGIDPTGHATFYVPDSSGKYVGADGNDNLLGPKPGQPVVGTPEAANLISAPDDDYSNNPYTGMAGHLCGGGTCVETFAHQQWWSEFITSPGYDYLYGPGFSEEELDRLGRKIMPNGRPIIVGMDFYGSPTDIQEAFLAVYTPKESNEYLREMWFAMGGYGVMSAAANGTGNGRGSGKTPPGTRDGDVCGGRHCTAAQAAAACVKQGYSKAQCAEKNWRQGDWRLYLKIVGVWQLTGMKDSPPLWISDTVSWIMDKIKLLGIIAEYRYRFDVHQRDTMFIWRKVNSLQICLNNGCSRYKMLYYTQWRTTVQTGWRAWVQIETRVRWTGEWIIAWQGHAYAGRPHYTYKTWYGTPDQAYLDLCKGVNESPSMGHMCSTR